jgi:hypothetical protein
MADAYRHVRQDEIQAGYFMFLATGVYYSHTGIQGLMYSAPTDNNNWVFSGSSSAYSQEYDAATSRINNRVTATAGGGTGTLRKRVLLPRGYGYPPYVGLMVWTRSGSNLPTVQTLTMLFNGSADPGINASNIAPALPSTYEQTFWIYTGNYVSGDFVTLQMDFTLASNGDWCEIGDLELLYYSGRGNV